MSAIPFFPPRPFVTLASLHPLIEAAAKGQLPQWARISDKRRAHCESVAALMRDWSQALGLDETDRKRWMAAAWLHDSLRDADPGEFAHEASDFPRRVRHGPAAAARLRAEGVDDEELLDAIAYHTLGHPEFGRLGRFLYLADYLDPLRSTEPEQRAELRGRLPASEREVLRTVCAQRIAHQLKRGTAIRPETLEFRNELADRDD